MYYKHCCPFYMEGTPSYRGNLWERASPNCTQNNRLWNDVSKILCPGFAFYYYLQPFKSKILSQDESHSHYHLQSAKQQALIHIDFYISSMSREIFVKPKPN